MRAEIVGAGFAGLVAATALAQRGWKVRVHERSPEVRAFGAGIFVWENGLRVLRAIGAYEDTVRNAHEADYYYLRDENNQQLGEAEFGLDVGTRMLTMTRQNLHEAVYSAALRSGVEVALNSHVVSADPSGSIRTASGNEYSADLIVGADGVNSHVRESVGLLRTRVKTGYGAIRLLLPRIPGESGDVCFYRSTGTRTTLYVPCDEENLYLCLTSKVEDAAARRLPLDKEAWGETFDFLRPLYNRIGDQGRWDEFETIKLEKWHKGRIAIIGDAAHAMTPSLGQGAGCAMMNALTLAAAVASEGVSEETLEKWEASERPLTEHTQDYAQETTQCGAKLTSRGTKWTDDALRTARYIPRATLQLSA